MSLRSLGLVTALFLAGCKAPVAEAPRHEAPGLAARFDAALVRESVAPDDPAGYLDAIDAALSDWNDPWAVAVVTAAVERLVWPTGELPREMDHAVVHRQRGALVEVTRRLGAAYARAEGHPILGPMLALSLHELALAAGAEPEAAALRRRGGCVPEAWVTGALTWPGRAGLDAELDLTSLGALPARLPSLPPFVRDVAFERTSSDACAFDFDATGSSGGLHAIVVDAIVPEAGWLYLTVAARSPLRAEIGGQTMVRRDVDTTEGTALTVGRAWVERGRARLVVRVAPAEREERVTLQLVTADGRPLATAVPRAGEVATARARDAAMVELIPAATTRPEVVTAASAELALGLDRRAARRLEESPATQGTPAPHVARLRVRADRVAAERHAPDLDVEHASLSAAARRDCPNCWDARLAHARVLAERRGLETGPFAALESLGVGPNPATLATERSTPELAAIAEMAAGANLRDLAEGALAALVARAPGSALAAMVDAELHKRTGPDLVRASCEGGLSRGTTGCLMALVDVGDLHGTLRELARLRRLRGSPALYRKLELGQLLAHGEVERAARLYELLPPALRDTTVLAELDPTEARRRLTRDRDRLGDAPYGLEPLARLVGVVPDPAPDLVAEGRRLVAMDRVNAFLPGAGTAVLKHVERYVLSERGELSYVTYDLRRVSDTEDVASRAEAENPQVVGLATSRVLRRTIHKRDGRELDPDPNARGSQGHTDLSQLEKGDYVEVVTVGWAIPEEHGQLVVDTPDLMPERTSVREAVVELSRPTRVPMRVWSHAQLGAGATVERDGQTVTTWKLSERSPRRIESDVPALEASVGVSFGTDDPSRVARALQAHLARRDDGGDYVARWVDATLGPEKPKLVPRDRVARLVAAVGKAVREGEPRGLGDHLAAYATGSAESARLILERGSGSRSWVLHRALREAAIPSTIAIAETSPFSASPNFPAHLGRFTHPLVLAKVGGGEVWLDVDVAGPPLPPGHVSPELRGRLALLPDGALVRIDAASEEDADAIDIDLALDETGRASGTFRATLQGEAAQEVARALESLVGEPRTNLLRGLVLGWVPWADVRDVALTSGEGSWQVSVSARIAPSNLAEPDDRDGGTYSLPGLEPYHVVVPAPDASSLTARYGTKAGRTSALAIETPLLFRVTRRIALPTGASVSSRPPVVDVRGHGLVARRAVEDEPGALVERFEVNLPVGVVEATEVDRFAAELRAVDEGFAYATRATWKRGPSSATAADKAKGRGRAPRPQAPAKAAPTPSTRAPRKR